MAQYRATAFHGLFSQARHALNGRSSSVGVGLASVLAARMHTMSFPDGYVEESPYHWRSYSARLSIFTYTVWT